MDVYFAGSIRGATFEGKEECYQAIIDAIRERHTLLSEHEAVTGAQGVIPDRRIWLRDIDWLDHADVMIAEVTAPSLGVGYEIAYALENRRIPVLCLYKQGTRVSAMLLGDHRIQHADYDNVESVKQAVTLWLDEV